MEKFNQRSFNAHKIRWGNLYTVLLSLLGVFTANAQVSLYTFTQSNAAYSEIANPIELGKAVDNTSAGSLNSNVYNVTLPFAFNYNAQDYTAINVSSNGFITFGSTPPAATTTTPISGTVAYDGAVSAFGGDLNSYFDLTTAGSITWGTEGTAPNRIAVIQWHNFRPANSTSTTNVYLLSFQIRLHETSNRISVVYAGGQYLTGSTTITATRQVGLRGANNSDYNNRLSSTTVLFDASTAGTANNSSQAVNTQVNPPGMPPAGLTYSWSPPTCIMPSGLSAGNITQNGALLTWNASVTPPANGYEIYYNTTGTAPTSTTLPTVSGITGLSYQLSGVLSPSTTYYIWIRSNCAAGDQSTWIAQPVIVSTSCVPPAVLSTTGDTVCMNEPAVLSATVQAGATVNWYPTSAGGTPLATGNSFTTPPLTATTSYWVSASEGTAGPTGKAAPETGATPGAGTTNFGLVFDVFAPVTIETVTIYPVSASSAAGTVVIDVINSTGAIVHSATVNVTGSPSSAPIPQVVNLGFAMAPGSNYKMRPRSMTGFSQLLFDPAAVAPAGGYAYPYSFPGLLTINTSTLTAAPTNTARNDLYYYFYNWQLSSKCESALQEVIATVDPNCSMSVSDVANALVLITISPNPMTDFATINTKATVTKVEFYSMTGGLALSESGRKISAVDVRRLTPGNYVAVLTLQDGTQYSRKVIKK